MALVLCGGCRKRDLEIEKLNAVVRGLCVENQRLRAELATPNRETHRQAAPFRRDKHVEKPKKPGRPVGHPPAHRPVPQTVHHTVDVPCVHCPDCRVELIERKTVVQYQTDLPPIVPIVTQFNIETGYRKQCRKRRQGRHPDQISTRVLATR